MALLTAFARPVKASKATANYRAGRDAKRCANCTMFRPPSSCISVTGEISPSALCNYFKAKPK